MTAPNRVGLGLYGHSTLRIVWPYNKLLAETSYGRCSRTGDIHFVNNRLKNTRRVIYGLSITWLRCESLANLKRRYLIQSKLFLKEAD